MMLQYFFDDLETHKSHLESDWFVSRGQGKFNGSLTDSKLNKKEIMAALLFRLSSGG